MLKSTPPVAPLIQTTGHIDNSDQMPQSIIWSMRHDPLILRTDVPFASSLTDNPYLWWNESSSCHFALSCDAIVTVSASVPVIVPQPAPCPILPVQGP